VRSAQPSVNEASFAGQTQEQFSAWATRLGKSRFIARQLSRRGGELHCELRCERVTIAEYAVKFLDGEIVVPG
jgi:hypothetical protein